MSDQIMKTYITQIKKQVAKNEHVPYAVIKNDFIIEDNDILEMLRKNINNGETAQDAIDSTLDEIDEQLSILKEIEDEGRPDIIKFHCP